MKLTNELVVEIYSVTKKFPESERFSLTNQLQRAVVSIPTNIAEGSGRIGLKDKANFTSIAYASLMEVLNLIIISKDLGYIVEIKFVDLREKIDVISYKLSALRSSQLTTKH